MLGSEKQSTRISQLNFGNANISGSVSTGNLTITSVGTNSYLIYTPTCTGAGYNADPWTYTANAAGTFSVSGNTALLDIFIVGQGGYAGNPPSGGNASGGSGGAVNYYANVIVPVGTYSINVPNPVFWQAATTVNTAATVLTATNGYNGYAGPSNGGNGAGNVAFGPQNNFNGGWGIAWPFGDSVPVPPEVAHTGISNYNSSVLFGAGGGGISGADYVYGTTGGQGGTTGGGSGGITTSYSPGSGTYSAGYPTLGGGRGAGGDENFVDTYPGSGMVVIRHKSS